MPKFHSLKLYWTPEIPDILVVEYEDEPTEFLRFDPTAADTPAFLKKAVLKSLTINPAKAV